MKPVYRIVIVLVIMILYIGKISASEKTLSGITELTSINSLSGSAIIKGQVTWKNDGTPVAGAVIQVVYLKPTGYDVKARLLTDENGRYAVEGLEEGKYSVGMSGAVLQGNKFIYRFVNIGQHNLQINNNTTNEINFQVEAGCAISGKVIHQTTGQPVKNAIIRLFNPGWEEVSRLRSSTDSTGNYFIAGLDENAEFYLAATGEIGYDDSTKLSLVVLDSVLNGKYYPEAEKRSGAKIVKLTSNLIDNLNFTLSGNAICGFVRRKADKTPVFYTNVILYKENWEFLEQANIDPFGNGFYFIRNLIPGQKIYIEANGWNWVENRKVFPSLFYDNAHKREDATPLTIADELKEIDFYLDDGIFIKGKVFQQDNNEPIARTRIIVYDSLWNFINEGSTNDTGDFSIIVSPGSYYVEANGFVDFTDKYIPVYQKEFYQESGDRAGAQLVHVTQEVNNINFTLNKLMIVHGKVTREQDGTPIPEAQIYVYNENWDYVREARTDQDGEFDFYDLEAGKSYFFEANGKILWNYGDYYDWNRFYWPEYYQEAEIRENAKLVQLTGTIPPVNFTLRDFEGISISGKVTRQDNGEAIPGCDVSVFDTNRTRIEYLRTSSNGEYTTPKLAPGIYYLEAWGSCETGNGWRKIYRTEYYLESPNWDGATPIKLEHDLTGINFTLVEGIIITGHIFDPRKGSPVVDAQIQLFDSQWNYIVERRSDHTGFYDFFDLMPGAYYIKATGKIYEDVGGYGDFVTHYQPAFYEHASREQDAVLININSNIKGIDIELFETTAVRISGKIIDNKDSKPIPKAEICLYSQNRQMLKKCLSDVNGYYEINGLKGGETYYLKATGYYIDDQNQRVKDFA
ncbi:carboxypeptidase regulatory-like domain-containing protein, partial [candidate division KSB1 bacterium]|nr:carboxypeptidase regulatory-like domain-containing protein [candidate division KSB1 bacterium]